MTLLETVQKLQEIEQKATPAPLQKWHQTGVEGTEYCIQLGPGYHIININECDQNAIVDLRNAARDMLDVLGCFQRGDAQKLQYLLEDYESVGMDLPDELCEVLRRLQEAARRMEE